MGDNGQPGLSATESIVAERQELAAVLGSATFARAQRLVKLLEYICESHFAGRDSDVCEFSIATEVLGRPTNFDPAEDAIARVEIHRLRKKLRDYYAGEGATRPLKIIIPPGLYTPVFQQDSPPLSVSGENGAAIAAETPEVAEAASGKQ